MKKKILAMLAMIVLSLLMLSACESNKKVIISRPTLETAISYYSDFQKGLQCATSEEKKAMEDYKKNYPDIITDEVQNPLLIQIDGSVYVFYTLPDGQIGKKRIE